MKKNVLNWSDGFLGPVHSPTGVGSFFYISLANFVESCFFASLLPLHILTLSPQLPVGLGLAHKHIVFPLRLCLLSLLPQLLLDLSFSHSLSQISSVHLWIVSLSVAVPLYSQSLHSIRLCLSPASPPLPSSISPATLFISSELSLLSSLLRVVATKFLLDLVQQKHGWKDYAMNYVNT